MLDSGGAIIGPGGLRIGFWFCIAVAMTVVLRRALALSTPPNAHTPAQLGALDAYFATHARLTYVHILCSLAFVSFAAISLLEGTRGSIRMEQAFFCLGVMVGGTAYAMSTPAWSISLSL